MRIFFSFFFLERGQLSVGEFQIFNAFPLGNLLYYKCILLLDLSFMRILLHQLLAYSSVCLGGKYFYPLCKVLIEK